MNDLHRRLRANLEGRYAIERELGRGGMATVFLGRDLRHERPVALKVLHPELGVSLGAEAAHPRSTYEPFRLAHRR